MDVQKLNAAVQMKQLKEKFSEDIFNFLQYRRRSASMKFKAMFGTLIGVGGYYMTTSMADSTGMPQTGFLFTLLKIGSILLPFVGLVLVLMALYIERMAESALRRKGVPDAVIAYVKKNDDTLDIG